jgi:septal ring factor EnvC (AmiA/AmiB activator)
MLTADLQRCALAVLTPVLVLAVLLPPEIADAEKHKPAKSSDETAAPASSADPAELARLRERIEALRQNLAGAEESRAEASDSLRESERAISEVNRGLYGLNRQKREVQGRLKELGGQSKTAESGIAAQRSRLQRLLALQAMSGERDYFKLVFNGSDPNSVARDLTYYSYVSRAQAALIQSLRKGLKHVQELAEQTRDKGAELSAIEAEQQRARRSLLAEEAERRRVLDQIAAKIRSQRREIGVLKRNEERLSKLVDALGRMLAAEPPRQPGLRNERTPEAAGFAGGELFAKLKGRLRLPIRGELTNRYGAKRSDGGVTWKGLFIRGNPGTEVRAVADGQVVFADWIRGFGNLAIVDHGHRYLSIYGNNETLLREVGSHVATGDVIATVGNSGGNPESGLYFELRYEGRAFDPMKWVSLK